VCSLRDMLAQQFHCDLARPGTNATKGRVSCLPTALKLCRSPQEAEDLHPDFLPPLLVARLAATTRPVGCSVVCWWPPALVAPPIGPQSPQSAAIRFWRKVQPVVESQLLPRTSRGPQECAPRPTTCRAGACPAVAIRCPPRQRRLLRSVWRTTGAQPCRRSPASFAAAPSAPSKP